MATRPRPEPRPRRHPRRLGRRVTLGEAEAFLASHPDLRGGRGRPRRGEATVIPALIARFGCSPATAKRLLARLRERRRRSAAIALPLPPAQAALLAAIAARYQGHAEKGSDEALEKGSLPSSRTQPSITQPLARPSSRRPALAPLPDPAALRGQLVDILQSWEKADPLWTLIRPLLPAPLRAEDVSPAPTPGDSASVARAVLIEALEAYEASVHEGEAVLRAMRSLRAYLEQRQAQQATVASRASI